MHVRKIEIFSWEPKMGSRRYVHHKNRMTLLSYEGYEPVPPPNSTSDTPTERQGLSALLYSSSKNAPGASRSLLNYNPLNDKNTTTNHRIPLPNWLVTDLDLARRDG